jgi:hypothetical protein
MTMRRMIVAIMALALILPFGIVSIAAAQEATPTAVGFDDLGLPTLDIQVTGEGYEGIPESVEAGRYLVTVNVSDDLADFGGGGVGFIQPDGMSADEFVGMLTSMSEGGAEDAGASPDAMASPAAMEMDDAASPVAGGQEEIPPFFFSSRFAGGVYAPPGGSAQVVLDLTPGEWVAWGDDPAAPWPPVAFEATGEMPADLPEPAAGAVLTMGEYFIDVTEGELTAGPQIIRVDNIGAQPHFVVAGRTEVEITEADIEAVLASDMTGTPAAVDFDPDEDFDDVFYTGTQSMGTSQWIVADLTAGTHILLCFFPDIAEGLPHANLGMYTIVEVTE